MKVLEGQVRGPTSGKEGERERKGEREIGKKLKSRGERIRQAETERRMEKQTAPFGTGRSEAVVSGACPPCRQSGAEGQWVGSGYF